jgi:hypothetical protein
VNLVDAATLGVLMFGAAVTSTAFMQAEQDTAAFTSLLWLSIASSMAAFVLMIVSL